MEQKGEVGLASDQPSSKRARLNPYPSITANPAISVNPSIGGDREQGQLGFMEDIYGLNSVTSPPNPNSHLVSEMIKTLELVISSSSSTENSNQEGLNMISNVNSNISNNNEAASYSTTASNGSLLQCKTTLQLSLEDGMNGTLAETASTSSNSSCRNNSYYGFDLDLLVQASDDQLLGFLPTPNFSGVQVYVSRKISEDLPFPDLIPDSLPVSGVNYLQCPFGEDEDCIWRFNLEESLF